MNNFLTGWYLIYTKPRHEKKVSTRFEEMALNFLMPTKKSLRTWHDRKKYIDEPLFPSYIFIFLNNMHDYYNSMGTDGVLYYVKYGDRIARVNDTVINNIKLLSEQGRDVEVSDEYIQPGQQLVISQGALTGLNCEVVELHGKQKLMVRVELLKRNIFISLPVEHVMAMS